MKKFLIMLVVAAAFTACNNDGTGTDDGADTVKPDTTPGVVTPDTLTAPVDTLGGDTSRM